MASKYRASATVLLSSFLVGGTIYTFFGIPIEETNLYIVDRQEPREEIVELLEVPEEIEDLFEEEDEDFEITEDEGDIPVLRFEDEEEPIQEEVTPTPEPVIIQEEIKTNPPEQPVPTEKPNKNATLDYYSDGSINPQTIAENNTRLNRTNNYRTGSLGKQWEKQLLDPSNLAWWKEREENMRKNPQDYKYESDKFKEVFEKIKDVNESDGKFLMQACKESYNIIYVGGLKRNNKVVRDVWTWCLKPAGRGN